MEPSPYAGAGGKIRRSPPPRAAATPYDRPPAAAAAHRLAAAAAAAAAADAYPGQDGEGGGWLSRLVDPARRLIAGGAARLFSTVFRKRFAPALALPEPPLSTPPGRDTEPNQGLPESTRTGSTPILEVGMEKGKNPASSSDNKALSEVEHLLMRKTFTRAELNRLTALLSARTVESDLPAQLDYHEDKSESRTIIGGIGGFTPRGMAADHSPTADVTDVLAQAGLESLNLIVGIDFTTSNEWTGKLSFHGRSLHHISSAPNPYEQAISIIGQTLSKFDEDNLIPCFGFGDASTHDQDVFSFYPDERPCYGFSEALERYRELVPRLHLDGPTSFAPIIEMAMTIVEQSGGQYHVLFIIADGQVTRSVDTASGQLSSQEQRTVHAIVKASELPLSIVLVGVGDGPWDMMKEFDDNIPARAFDNFQFVNFSEIMSENMPQTRKEAAFALSALMEIPQQYKATVELGILGRRSLKSPETGRVPRPPPTRSHDAYSYGSKSFSKPSTNPQSSASQSSYPPYDPQSSSASSPIAAPSTDDYKLCAVCLVNLKDMAFGCGHQSCRDCGPSLDSCPICRRPITARINLY